MIKINPANLESRYSCRLDYLKLRLAGDRIRANAARRNGGDLMANLNKVMLIGRLTREPEARSFSNGGKVVKFGFAVNNRKKNMSTGQWEDEPVFVDCEAFNRGDQGGLADRIEQSLHKGSQIFVEGHLRFDQWTDKEGNKRSRLARPGRQLPVSGSSR